MSSVVSLTPLKRREKQRELALTPAMAFNIDEAVGAAQRLVNEAHTEGKLHNLTNRIVRQEVERVLELESGTLEDKMHRKILNEAIHAAVAAAQAKDGNDDDALDAAEVGKTKKSKSSTANAGSVVTGKAGPSSAAKVREIERKPAVSKGDKSRGQNKNFKSKETIDDDADEEGTSTMPPQKETKKRKSTVEDDETSPKRRKNNSTSAKTSSSEKSKSKRSLNVANTSPSSGGMDKKDSSLDEKKPDMVKLTEGAATHDGSDSELSVLIDDDPQPNRKKDKQKFKTMPKEKKVREKKAPKELSPDEEQLKKLKSLVVACGVRKMWSKELQGLDTTSQQISHVRQILSDLGMKGRFSVEQAKTIRERREFAKELEDVREFADKHSGEGRASRAKAKAVKASAPTDEDDQDGESGDNDQSQSDTGNTSRRPRVSAHRSIMAFLDDQSDSE